MQPLTNINNAYLNEDISRSTNLQESPSLALYASRIITKALHVVHKVYAVDKPEDSFFKMGIKYLGRTLFATSEVISANSLIPAGVAGISITSGFITKYISTENNNYANSLIYCGGISITLLIINKFITLISFICKETKEHIKYIIMVEKCLELMNKYPNITNTDIALIDQKIEALREMVQQQAEDLRELEQQRDLLDATSPLSQRTALTDKIHRKYSLQISVREVYQQIVSLHERFTAINFNNAILASINALIKPYDQLTPYAGSNLDPGTMSIIECTELSSIKEPVFYEQQVYEYKSLVNWYKLNGNCPHNRESLNWTKVFRINKVS